MGAYDYMWNAIQAGQISDLREEVTDLKEKVDILKEWVDYLRKEQEDMSGWRKQQIANIMAGAEQMSDSGYSIATEHRPNLAMEKLMKKANIFALYRNAVAAATAITPPIDNAGVLSRDWESLVTEKFAELVVRECCSSIKDRYEWDTEPTSPSALSREVQDMLIEHFGFE